MISSWFCIVHCLVTPLVLVFQVGFSTHYTPHWHYLHHVFVGASFIACYISTRKGATPTLVLLLWSFFGLLLASLLLHDTSDIFEYTTYLASLGLVICHFLNIKYCRKCHSKAV
ncbi:MerC domain-containing protein [Pontibacter sp. 13R65]|uniref:MerC domain-containing protein n=1 Tax=Pontibacter sp. 13R65 TaxID=3127458 RepID=UPI00301BAD0A